MKPAVNSRIEIESEHGTMSGRVLNVQGRMIHIELGRTSSDLQVVESGSNVNVCVLQDGRRWTAESTAREWVWGRPPILVIGPVSDWQETGRSARAKHEL